MARHAHIDVISVHWICGFGGMFTMFGDGWTQLLLAVHATVLFGQHFREPPTMRALDLR